MKSSAKFPDSCWIPLLLSDAISELIIYSLHFSSDNLSGVVHVINIKKSLSGMQ